jgi:hypothetical protein
MTQHLAPMGNNRIGIDTFKQALRACDLSQKWENENEG